MKTHHDLDAWKLGIELADLVYRTTRGFPAEERFGITSQMRRSAVSVPSNIAEGAARATTKEYRRFLIIARASLTELETLVIIAANAGYLQPDERSHLSKLRTDAAKTLQGLIHSLSQNELSTPRCDHDHRGPVGSQITDHKSQITNHKSLITDH